MRRRTAEFRRPAKRRLSRGFWIVLFGLVIVLFIVIFSHERKPEVNPLLSQQARRQASIIPGLNITEEMVDPYSLTRQLGDQISLAKAFVVIAKESNNLQFAWELSAQIRNSQILLSNVATRSSPLTASEAETSIRDMSLLIHQAKQLHYDSATVIMKLKAQISALEERVNSASVQSTTFGQLAAEAIPKSLYCLGTKLTIEWFKNSNSRNPSFSEKRLASKLRDNSLYHFCVFSDNLLAASVVVNSTALNANRPDLIVFHLVTDGVNLPAMKAWFSMNRFKGITVEVQNIEDFSWLNASYAPVLKQLQDSETQSYYFSGTPDSKSPIKFRNPKYLSMLNHLRFYIPEVYPFLKKLVFLDDDVVVQKDLSPLFSLDLHGNVNGAVETCLETFHRYHKYLNFSHPLIRAHFDPDACGWAFGMNVFDLVEWRERNVTGIYHYWQERNVDRTLWKLGTLPPGLLTFYGLTEPLDPRWHVLGLGYDPNVDPKAIENGAVVHYNGNMKPWLKIGMSKYKGLWEKYVGYSHPLLQQCNVH
ncbi:probable galacturonosyltransferase 10 [Amborella trichopoda]|uniref:probable galacturonosyltransferase 10 n=1 Tax=Amborella trichopoda TaxID=13333 RepID=UPI0005D3837B|nr:probable galacturonosyltransferase 10 [Amborella trichopoda]|eukprot:XP_006841805.2 probable galacturonosyltransferase 10 [Amborella trichopoda]